MSKFQFSFSSNGEFRNKGRCHLAFATGALKHFGGDCYFEPAGNQVVVIT